MSIPIYKTPQELLVHILDRLSTDELLAFKVPDRRFYNAWISALKNRNKHGTPLHLGVTIQKIVRQETHQHPEKYGALLARCIKEAAVPTVTLSENEQFEGKPNPAKTRFKKSPIITGTVTNTNLQFFSMMMTKENGDPVIWTSYQRFSDSIDYWTKGNRDFDTDSDSRFLTKKALLKLSRILLTPGCDLTYRAEQTVLAPPEMKGASQDQDSAC